MRKVLIIAEGDRPNLSLRQTPGGSGLWLREEHPECRLQNDYQYYINDYSKDVDFVLVRGCAIKKTTMFPLPKSNIILLTSEPFSIQEYPKAYRDQFGLVCSCQDHLADANAVQTPPFLDWYVGIRFRDKEEAVTLTYDDFKEVNIKKDKLISVVTSNKLYSSGHYHRLQFVRRLKEHFGDMLDVYGRGINGFEDKWDVIAPYKYHIVIENSSSKNYFTEKLTDSFIGGAYPIYYGCPNAGSYFPKNSFVPIDIHNIESSISAIETCIRADYYRKYNSELTKGRIMALENFNMFNLISEVLDSMPSCDIDKMKLTCIKPCKRFFSMHNLRLWIIERNRYRLRQLWHK